MSTKIIETTDTEQWLEARRNYITASDMGKLANGGPSAWAAVKAAKYGEQGFTGNVYTEWGHEREPVMMGYLAFLFDIEANSNLYVSGKRAATPDGISDTMLAEVKTTVKPWADLDDLRATRPQYYDQVQWAQLVCERDKTIFGFEPHQNFVPAPFEHFEIGRDEKRIQELIEIEEKFWEYLEEETVSNEFDEFMARYSTALAVLKEAEASVEELKAEIHERLGDKEVSLETAFGKITRSRQKPSNRFDSTGFRKAHPDLAKEFTVQTKPKQEFRLTITPR